MNENTPPESALLDQAALFALDALPADEAARFRATARANPSLAALVAEYEDTASLFADVLPPVTPPSGLRAQILAAAGRNSAASDPPPAVGHHPSAAIFVPWGVAAALAVSLGLMWLENQELGHEKSTLRDRVAVLANVQKELGALRATAIAKNREAAELRAQLDNLALRSGRTEAQVSLLTSNLEPTCLAAVGWNPDTQTGRLEVRGLPVADNGKDYQLWIIGPAGSEPVSGGVVPVGPEGAATVRFSPAQTVTTAEAFAISVEPDGGSPAPSGPIVLD